MSKSVLVIDTPEDCHSCYLRGFTLNLQYCRAKQGSAIIVDTSVKPDWCPLKPLPEKDDFVNVPHDEYYTGYHDGWDNCIDEITGGNADD